MATEEKPRLAPIAIVGMSCRLSGDVSTLDDFWTLISRSRDGWCPNPEERFSSNAFHHPNPQKKGCFNQRGGYFMNYDFSQFDAPFFHITKQEAIAMDPQQRQLLECTYEALENAGIPKSSIAGRNMGVFVGGKTSDYRLGLLRDLDQIPMFEATGNHQSIQAGRISYYFDLHGPCLAIDTACSSSLSALHLAVQSIRSGESDSAMVAGCNLYLEPDVSVSMSMLGLFNDEGKTYAFDHRAKSGFSRGEGVGCLVLKPLDKAIEDGDNIYSVIVNTGINQDGKTVGITNPSGEAQERLIRDVYSRAGISPQDTGFVEAHGTGTKVGDPIEADAIYRVFSDGRTKRHPLYMGSVKTNFGHLENASGIISIIKTSLMLKKGLILPNTHFEKPNDEVPLDDGKIKIATSLRPWPRNKRFASINNFGFGGSNGHVVLERPPFSLGDLPQGFEKGTSPKLFVLSANDECAVKRLVSQLGVYLEQHPEVFQKRLIHDIAYTLGERRTHLPWRIALPAFSCDELAASLNGLGAIPKRVSGSPKLAFVFTGQGAQWPQMGKDLLSSHPVFAETLTVASNCLQQLGASFSLLEELCKSKEESNVSKAHISQPVCTAVQLGLTDLLSSWGIKPSVVTGHSSGEIAAAYATGAITLENAMAIAYYRGQVANNIKVKFSKLRGSMLAVGAGPREVNHLIKKLDLNGVTVACENSPSSITASGDEAALEILSNELNAQGTFNRKLHVDVAYHSAHMKLVEDDYMATIKDLRPKDVDGVVFYSSLLGSKLDTTLSLGSSYWVENLTKPVRFSSALHDLYVDTKPDTIVEIGPHAALKGPITQILKAVSPQAASEVKYFPSLLRFQHATVAALKLAGNLFSQGHSVDFAAVNQTTVNGQKPSVVSDFQPYPWSNHKYWFESRITKQHRLKPFARHDLLGTLEDNYNNVEPTWRNVLSSDDVPWLRDHRMQSLTTFPLVGYLCMAVEAVSQRAQLRGIQAQDIAGFRLREIYASKALIIDDGTQYETHVSLKAQPEGTRSYSTDWDEFRISSWTSTRGWQEHCRGLIGIKKQRDANPVNDTKLQSAIARRKKVESLGGDQVSLESFYAELESHGAGYSSFFKHQANASLRVCDEYSIGHVTVPDTASAMPHCHETSSTLPPAFADLFVQLTFAILGAGRGKMNSLFMPSAIQEAEISCLLPNRPGSQVQVVANGRPDFANPRPVDFSIDAWHDSQTEPVLKLTGFKMTPVNSDTEKDQTPRSLCYDLRWEALGVVPKEEDGCEPVQCNGTHDREPAFHDVKQNGCNGNLTEARAPVVDDQHVNSRLKVEAIEQNMNNAAHVNENVNGHAQHVITNGLLKESESQIVQTCRKSPSPEAKPEINGQHPQINGINGHAVSSEISLTKATSDAVTLITDRNESDPVILALFNLIALQSGSKPSVLPFSKVPPSPSAQYICLMELDAPFLHRISAENFHLAKKLLTTCSSMLWVTSGAYHSPSNPEHNIIQGLLRTVRSELSIPAATLDLDPNSQLDPYDHAILIYLAYKASCIPSENPSPVDYEFAEQSGRLVVPRVMEQKQMNLDIFREIQSSAPYLQDFQQAGRRLKVVVGTFGALDSLYWKDEPEPSLAADEVEIKIAFTGVNFKDVVIAMGQVASPYLGVECSGTIARVGSNVTHLKPGDRVCAMSQGAYGTYAKCPATSAAAIPENMGLDTAASIPVVYSTAYYGLVELARMEQGESVLIHAASGGVGQAAIQLAQMIGAEIYATVGSAEKKKLLIDTYGIPESHIFYSRDTDFGPGIREATGGKGVDVVLNSLAGDLLRESWASLGSFGRFIEIGKRDIISNTRLEMSKFDQNCTFSSVDLTLVAAERPKIMSRVLTAVMLLLEKGTVRPIGPISTVGIGEAETALRNLQSGKSSGKVVVNHLVGQKVKATHPPASTMLQRNATYVIIGGTGGIGRSIAKRMVDRGAGHIVLLSRSGNSTTELEQLVSDSQSAGASIYVKACDVADRASVTALMAELQSTLPPIKGLVHAAMVLRDVLFEQMTFEDYDAVLRSKVLGSWNLHKALLNTPLDFFILLSSVAGIVGNRGQAAYAGANTYLDALAHYRQRNGLPAVSLNLAAVEGVGYLAENAAKQSQVLTNLSGSVMDESEVLALVEQVIFHCSTDNSSIGSQFITGLHFEDPSSLPYWATDGKFSYLRNAALAKGKDTNTSTSPTETHIAHRVQRASSFDEAQEIVTVGLRDRLAAILMVPAQSLESQQATMSITAAGLDSLNAIELRNWIGKELQAHLQVLELLTSGGVRDLAALVLRKTRLTGAWSEQEK